jgi:hypothetical protein
MSTAKFDTLSNLAGTQSVPVATVAQGSAKAWVNFNGTGTVAIRASFNVTSITDGGTGTYTVNFTTAMPDTNYSVSALASRLSGGYAAVCEIQSAILLTTTTAEIHVRISTNGNEADAAVVTFQAFR